MLQATWEEPFDHVRPHDRAASDQASQQGGALGVETGDRVELIEARLVG